LLLPLALSLAFILDSSAFAWGRLGHRIVGRAATELTEDGRLFWTANEDAIRSFSTTPDTAWKSGDSAGAEKPTHWFHFDFYSPEGASLPSFFRVYSEVLKRYDEGTVTDNGSATWRVQQFYLQALKNLRSSQYQEALQLAGAMSHYVGDLSQPLHVTVNYDGQLTGQKGIHKFFETDNLETVSAAELEDEVIRRAQVLLSNTSFRESFDQDLMHAMMLASRRSLLDAPKIFAADKSGGRSGRAADEMRDIAVDRMADGAATYALILSRLWRDGGQRDTDRALSPREPKWLAPDYSESEDGPTGRTRALRRAVHQIAGEPAFVDCE
jgi:hypothetical protein